MTASPDGRWEDREMDLFEAALALPEDEQLSWLQEVCSDSPDLLRLVEARLQKERRMAGFLLGPNIGPLRPAVSADCGLTPGDVVAGRFEIRREIAQGGMAVVFEGFDLKMNERVAVKCPKPEFRRRLLGELRSALKVTHPNICRLHEIHTTSADDGGIDFLTMEFLDGETLAERLRRGRPDKDEAVAIARQLCAGLAEAHSKGIVHGDLKPGNIILTHGDGGKVRAVITDFGLARLHNNLAPGGVGVSLRGTPEYIAPELWFGLPISRASDTYALGVILCQLLSGRLPGESGADWRNVPGRVRGRVRRMVERCLAEDPSRRPERIAEIEDTLLPAGPGILALRAVAAVAMAGVIFAGVGYYRAHAVPDIVRLAILPASTDTETAMVGSGVAYDLSDRLVPTGNQGKPLVVIPLQQAQESGVNGVEVARKTLGATHTLALRWKQSGSLYQVNGEIRDAQSDVVLGSFERRVGQASVGQLPEVVAGELADALGRKVSLGGGTVPAGGSRDYVEGIHFLREAKDPVRARASFEKAREAGEAPLLDVRRAEAEILDASVSHNPAALDRARSLLGGLRQGRVPDGPMARLVASLVDRTSPASGAAAWREAVRLHPEDGEIWRSFGESLRLTNQAPEEAVAAYKRAISLEPGYFEPWVNLGLHSYLRGHYEDARDQFAHAAALAPGLATAHTNLAGALMVLGDDQGAEKEFRQALNLLKDTRTLLGIGAVLAYQNRHAESVNYYEQAVALDPDDGNSLANLADAYRRTGNTETAGREYARLVEGTGRRLAASPSDLRAQTFHAYGQARLGNRAAAVAELRAMIRTSPDNVLVRRVAATAYEALGMRKQALDQIEAAPILISELSRQPDLAALRADPRFIQMKAEFNSRKAGPQQ